MTTQLLDERQKPNEGESTPSLPTVNSEEDESSETNSSSSGGQIAQLASFLKCCGQQIFNAESVKRKSSSKRDSLSTARSTAADQKGEICLFWNCSWWCERGTSNANANVISIIHLLGKVFVCFLKIIIFGSSLFAGRLYLPLYTVYATRAVSFFQSLICPRMNFS